MRDAEFAERAGFDALPCQAAVLDPEGRIVFTNRAWREFAAANGAGRRDHVGTNYLAVCEASDDDRARRIAARLRALLDGDRETVSVEYPCHSPDERRWFAMRAARFATGGRVRALVVHFDVTERKRAELALREQNERLETVAGVLAHDLRNPLNVALGRAEMMDGEHADAVIDSLERMASIVSDALVLARGDDPELRTVDLRERAERAWSQVETGDARLDVAGSTSLDADPDLLGHAFENLFRNAVEHGGDRVTVGPLDSGFYVEDDGPGIPADRREAVLERGYTTGESNTGLGLEIVAKVADAHGWTLDVAAGEAGGARFEIRS